MANKTEEDLFAMAMAEVKSNSRRTGLWAKALSESLGDERKAEALYIRYRAAQLTQERDQQKRSALDAERNEKVLFKCPECNKNLQLTKGTLADLAGQKYPNWNRSCPGCQKVFDIRNVIPSLPKPTTSTVRPPAATKPRTPNASKAQTAITFSAIGCIIPFLAIIGVVMGHQALAYVKKHPNETDGENNAIAAVVVGYIGIVIQLGLFMAGMAAQF
ncbi:MAG: DUF4190 domain-containing protein [Phycisphaerae bacterium]|nr:DUF4190 domain-containing protein [Phycisphaerae bacterium]